MSDLTSSVNFKDAPRVSRPIPVNAIMTLALTGITERGVVGSSPLLFDYPDYQKNYGGYTGNGDLAMVAEAYFDQGGTRLRVNRVVHFTDISDANTNTDTSATQTLNTSALAASQGTVVGTVAEPWALVNGETFSFSVDGGGSLVATFNAAAAVLTAGNTETYALADAQTLTVEINGVALPDVVFLTAEFASIGAATTAEVNAVLNAQLTGCSIDDDGGAPRITTDQLGTGASIEVTGGTANGALGFNTSIVNGTGDAADSGLISNAEMKVLIEADVAGVTASASGSFLQVVSDTTGASSSILVEAVSTGDDELGFDNATHSGAATGTFPTLLTDAKTSGEWANEVTIEISASGSGVAANFKLQVLRNGAPIETWDDMSMDPDSDRYVETHLNADAGSDYLTVTDQLAAVATDDKRPADGTSTVMTGGGDGLGSLGDTDFNGATGSNGDTGLRVLDLYTDLDVIASPDRATSSHHNAMVSYCDVIREGLLFAVLDPPAGLTATAMATYVRDTASLFQASENAAIYWPRVKALNPAKSVFGSDRLLTVPPSGYICGVYARNDASKVGGMFEQPAGFEEIALPDGIEELETEEVKDVKKRELLTPLNINCISQEEGGPIFFDGARNLDITGNWRSIGAARGVIFIKKSLKGPLAFLRHRNLKPRLYNEGKMTSETFMDSLLAAEAFEAYSTDWGTTLNPASVQALRKIVSKLGIAQWGVAEIIEMTVGPDSNNLEL